MALFGLLAAFLTHGIVLSMCMIKWRERLLGIWLQFALLCTVLWAGFSLLGSSSAWGHPANQVFFEIVRGSAWLLFALKLFDHGRGGRDFWALKLPWIAVFSALLALTLNVIDRVLNGVVSQLVPFAYLVPLLLVTAVLVVTEQWFRNVPAEQRWPVKFLLVAMLVMFVYDFLLYSEALLFGRIDPAFWDARGWVNALAAPLVAVAASRSLDWNRELRVSRRAVFFSASLLLSGLYLLMMALVGYYLKWFGAGVGSAIQIVFTVAGIVLFVLLASSGRIRSQITVWLNKHFLSYKYDYRSEWMLANARLASAPMDEGFYHALLKGIIDPVGSKGAALWLVEAGELRLADTLNSSYMASRDRSQDRALLDFMQSTGWVVDIDEYRVHPGRYPQDSVSSEFTKGDFWLLVPLQHQTRLIGVVGLAHPLVEQEANWEDFDLLKALGEQLAAMIVLKRTTDSLAEARQFEAYNQLSTFVVHDIKNVVAQLSMVVRNAEKHRHNPEFIDDALTTLASATGRMNRMLAQLKQRAEVGPKVCVDVLEVVDQVVKNQNAFLPAPRAINLPTECQVKVERERLLAALCHLVQNAQEATPDDGEVLVSAEVIDGNVYFRVQDNGSGMDKAFVQSSLFKPFVSSKGRAGMGIGVFEARQFAREHSGDLEVESELGKGSVFSLRLPTVSGIDQEAFDVKG